MARKLFGTDGVRGLAGEFVNAELALALGRAATSHTGAARPRVVIVRDTRESGEMLQSALAAGVSSAGGEALLAGVLPTPAASLLLGRAVQDGGHALGFAFDGDGDRLLAVDRRGEIVDGDELMALVAIDLRDSGRLRGGGVVVTVMTNYGFHTAMQRAGIAVATTAVGDRYVLEELRARAWMFGGEQSGYMIEMSFNRTGDGIAGALLTLEALAGADLGERHVMEKLPQRLVNVRVGERDALAHAEGVLEAVRAAEEELSGRGRVLVRPSGTEPLVRVMVEAPSEEEAGAMCDRLVAVVQRELA